MTPLCLRNAWITAAGTLLALSLAGCPRTDLGLGQTGDAGTSGTAGSGDAGRAGGGEAGRAGSPPSTQACGSRGLPECADGEFCSYSLRASCGDADVPGVCKKKPEICTLIYAPVCGCDGKTHASACAAESSGVSVRAQDACKPGEGSGQVCGGLRGQPCPDGEYCNYPDDAMCGIADASGTCKPKPEACDAIFAPVCGCNGKTYGNDCDAAMSGVSVASQGECKSDGQTCGGLQGAACPDGQFCDFARDAQCGAADQTGTCRDKPQVCTREYAPVCGCDDKTYATACVAASAGVSVASDGECPPSGGGVVCGVRGAATCADSEYCAFPEDSQCGAADEPGTCMPKPQACTLEFLEVCGCDGMTYGNRCQANSAGTSVASVGACDSGQGSGKSCGGIAGLSCPDSEFCSFPATASCGAADQLGQCQPKPGACTQEYRPVCGCDDKTYGNACMAASAGVSIARDGECGSGNAGSCGGLLGTACPDGQYCNYAPDAQCGAADQTGTCADKTQVCTREYVPVCGCDDKTYGNACEAASAGVSVVKAEAC